MERELESWSWRVLKKEMVATVDGEGNNLSEPDPEPGQRSPRDAQKKKEKKENRRGTTSYNQK